MKDEHFSFYGVAAALAEINRRNATAFEQAETRLAEKMKPARLSPSTGMENDLGILPLLRQGSGGQAAHPL